MSANPARARRPASRIALGLCVALLLFAVAPAAVVGTASACMDAIKGTCVTCPPPSPADDVVGCNGKPSILDP
jgi:hypothetical protein